MDIKEIYRILEASDFKDKDVRKSFEREINTYVVSNLIIENRELQSKIDDLFKINKLIMKTMIDTMDRDRLEKICMDFCNKNINSK